MNIFAALLKLYKGSELKTPLEDFTTEILASILQEDPKLLDMFVNAVLSIPGSNYQVNSQECFAYKKEGRKYVKIDLVFRNEDSICFLENKVGSKEGNDQLQSYSAVLKDLNSYQNKYLRYCTKYHEDKANIIAHSFIQIRWWKISDFLKKNTKTEIARTFMNFLELNQMGNSTEFTIAELLSLQHFNSGVLKMGTYIDKINPTFTNHFGTPKSIRAGSDVLKNSRVVLIKDNLFGFNYTEIGCGFDYKVTPKVLVWIWSGSNTPEAQIIKQLTVDHTVYNTTGYLEISKPLSDYLGSDEMELDIENWFRDAFIKVKKILKDNNIMCNIPV